MNSNIKKEIIDDIYLNYKNHNDYKAYLECAYNKYQFEKYGLKGNNIKDEDYIINDKNLRITINNIINKVQITQDDFDSVLMHSVNI